MKIIVFTDIHGNKEALSSIINDYKKLDYDRVICLGDVIGIGPNPIECLKLIKENNIEMTLGNHESYHRKEFKTKIEKNKNLHHIWIDSLLNEDLKDYINSLPIKIEINYNNYKLLFSHFLYKGNNINDLFYSFNYLDKNYKEFIKEHDFDYMFIGHEHKACQRGNIIDLGTSGCTFDNKTYYHIIDISKDIKIEKKVIEYDRSSFEKEFDILDFPLKEHLARNFFGIKLNDFNIELLKLKDFDYTRFQEKIIYTDKKIIGIRCSKLKEIASKLDLNNLDEYFNNTVFFENDMINSYLLNRIKDYDTFIKYFLIHKNNVDNWATCDTIKFNIKNHEEEYFKLAKELINSKERFERRLGLRILFSFKNNKKYLQRIILLINKLYKEKEYYVNMCISWLLTELLIYNRDYIISNLDNLNLNNFVKSKFVSKSYDSYRIDKETVLILKKWLKGEEYEK